MLSHSLRLQLLHFVWTQRLGVDVLARDHGLLVVQDMVDFLDVGLIDVLNDREVGATAVISQFEVLLVRLKS